MPPDHPFPAGLDDCLAAYRALLNDHPPESIVIGGVSAGGNLVAALVLRARDEGLPLPAAVVMMTPAVDLTESSDSLHTNQGLDFLLSGSGMPAFLLYAGDHDLTNPLVSPIYGDFSKGFPPTILTTGTRDLLLSDTVRMHRALRSAGVRGRAARHRSWRTRRIPRYRTRGRGDCSRDPSIHRRQRPIGAPREVTATCGARSRWRGQRLASATVEVSR